MIVREKLGNVELEVSPTTSCLGSDLLRGPCVLSRARAHRLQREMIILARREVWNNMRSLNKRIIVSAHEVAV